MILSLIAAISRNGVIGRDNRLLWHLPEDMKHFRARTMGSPVIMGRKTWESLPEKFRPLPGRRNIVVTRQPGFMAAGAAMAASLAEALSAATRDGAVRAFVIGGAQIYNEALPLADEIILTEIDRDFEGDVHFPDFSRGEFAEVQRETLHAAPPNDFDISFVTYRRSTPRS